MSKEKSHFTMFGMLPIFLLFLFVSINAGQKGVDGDSTKNNKVPDKTILFFLNPHGKPCQMQDQILKDMGKVLTDNALLVYVSTDISEDRSKFYEYGIRALPMLIVLDGEKKLLKRFPPGIQSAEAISSVIGKSSKSTKPEQSKKKSE